MTCCFNDNLWWTPAAIGVFGVKGELAPLGAWMLGDEFGVDIIVVVYKNATKNLRPNNSTFKAGLALYCFL